MTDHDLQTHTRGELDHVRAEPHLDAPSRADLADARRTWPAVPAPSSTPAVPSIAVFTDVIDGKELSLGWWPGGQAITLSVDGGTCTLGLDAAKRLASTIHEVLALARSKVGPSSTEPRNSAP